MKIFYHIDDDGKCAAFWVKEYLNFKPSEDGYENEFIKINYGMEFPLMSIKPNEDIYIVDYSIMPDEMKELLKITENVVWIDHHKSAIQRYAEFDKKIKGIRCDGVAGCILTFWYFYHIVMGGNSDDIENMSEDEIKERIVLIDSDIPYATRLIGDFDIWKFEYGEDTRMFHLGFSIIPHEPTDTIWDTLKRNNPPEMKTIITNGSAIKKYRKSLMEDYCNHVGFETTLNGYKCFAVNMALIGSDDFVIDNVYDYDILIGFSFNGEKWTYSLRSTTVDCSEIAMKYGGGGHKGAAGFSTQDCILKNISEGLQ